MPPNALSFLAKSFPTLTALDVGYASVQRGVSFEEVDLLCRRCDRLRHLDLSMVMTYVDFTPCLLTSSICMHVLTTAPRSSPQVRTIDAVVPIVTFATRFVVAGASPKQVRHAEL